MSDTLRYGLPRTLDDPARLLWWDMDQALLFCAFVIFGMMASYMLAGAVFGALTSWAYGKAKAGKHKSFAIHLMYWHLPRELLSFKRTPPSHIREYVG